MKRLALAIVMVLLAGALFIPVEVPSINQHEGAMAFAQPSITSSFPKSSGGCQQVLAGCLGIDEGSWDLYSGQLLGVDVGLNVTPEKYVAPEPVKKPLWQSLFFPSGSISLTPISGGSGSGTISNGGGTIGGGSTCTQKDLGTKTVNYKTYATMLITAPDGSQITWTSDVKSWSASYHVNQYVGCTGGPTGTGQPTGLGYSVYSTLAKVEVDYEPGTLYFTQGYGNYGFEIKIWRVDEGAASDTTIATLARTISVQAGDLA